MSWLLDTDVLSQLAKRNGNPQVVKWIERERTSCYTSAIVIAQLAYWVRTREGKQREALQNWLTRTVDAMQGRIHGFSVTVAPVWAALQRRLEEEGKRMPIEDSYIAATAQRHGHVIVTGNDRHFRRSGLKVLNPFEQFGSG
jgi:predicted nucleic acid-binding protein